MFDSTKHCCYKVTSLIFNRFVRWYKPPLRTCLGKEIWEKLEKILLLHSEVVAAAPLPRDSTGWREIWKEPSSKGCFHQELRCRAGVHQGGSPKHMGTLEKTPILDTESVPKRKWLLKQGNSMNVWMPGALKESYSSVFVPFGSLILLWVLTVLRYAWLLESVILLN